MKYKYILERYLILSQNGRSPYAIFKYSHFSMDKGTFYRLIYRMKEEKLLDLIDHHIVLTSIGQLELKELNRQIQKYIQQ